MSLGMWLLYRRSFERCLVTVCELDTKAAADTMKKAKPKYRQIIKGLPEFETAKLRAADRNPYS